MECLNHVRRIYCVHDWNERFDSPPLYAIQVPHSLDCMVHEHRAGENQRSWKDRKQLPQIYYNFHPNCLFISKSFIAAIFLSAHTHTLAECRARKNIKYKIHNDLLGFYKRNHMHGGKFTIFASDFITMQKFHKQFTHIHAYAHAHALTGLVFICVM